jgi:type IV pilus assembly protein PilC
MIYIIPKFQEIFDSLGVALPAPTRAVLWTSRAITQAWWGFGLGIALLVFLYKWYRSTESGGYKSDLAKVKLPVFGSLFQKVAISRFSRTFSTLIRSGVPILGALEIVAATAGNKVIERAVLAAREAVRAGEPLSKPLSESPIFPPMVVRMIAIGERSGALEQLLEKISQFYDEQVSAAVDALTSTIEPLMIGVMGLIVGGIVLAIFLPIIKIQQAVAR